MGIKGSPKLNSNMDCDVVCAEVRETSRKPDEMYDLLERLAPGSRKLEMFGRPHNVHKVRRHSSLGAAPPQALPFATSPTLRSSLSSSCLRAHPAVGVAQLIAVVCTFAGLDNLGQPVGQDVRDRAMAARPFAQRRSIRGGRPRAPANSA